MKALRLLPFLMPLVLSAQPVNNAYDTLLTQRNGTNTGNVQINVPGTTTGSPFMTLVGTQAPSGNFNFTGLVTIYGLTSTTISQHAWVEVWGNDSTGVVGQPLKPFRQPDAAARAMTSTLSGVITVGVGNFTTSQTLLMNSEWTLEGMGVGLTYVTKGAGINSYGIRNAGGLSGNADIIWRGMTWDGNNANNTWTTSSVSTWGFGQEILMLNVTRPTVQDIRLVSPTKFGIHIIGCTDVLLRHNDFPYSSFVTNQDGEHIQYSTFLVDGATGTTGDDLISIVTGEQLAVGADFYPLPAGNSTGTVQNVYQNGTGTAVRVDADTTGQVAAVHEYNIHQANINTPVLAIGFVGGTGELDVDAHGIYPPATVTTAGGDCVVSIQTSFQNVWLDGIVDHTTGVGHSVVKLSGNGNSLSVTHWDLIDNSSDNAGLVLVNAGTSFVVNVDIGTGILQSGTSTAANSILWNTSAAFAWSKINFHDFNLDYFKSVLNYANNSTAGISAQFSNLALTNGKSGSAVITNSSSAAMGIANYINVLSNLPLWGSVGSITAGVLNSTSSSVPLNTMNGSLVIGNGAVSGAQLTVTGTSSGDVDFVDSGETDTNSQDMKLTSRNGLFEGFAMNNNGSIKNTPFIYSLISNTWSLGGVVTFTNSPQFVSGNIVVTNGTDSHVSIVNTGAPSGRQYYDTEVNGSGQRVVRLLTNTGSAVLATLEVYDQATTTRTFSQNTVFGGPVTNSSTTVLGTSGTALRGYQSTTGTLASGTITITLSGLLPTSHLSINRTSNNGSTMLGSFSYVSTTGSATITSSVILTGVLVTATLDTSIVTVDAFNQ